MAVCSALFTLVANGYRLRSLKNRSQAAVQVTIMDNNSIDLFANEAKRNAGAPALY